MAQMDLLSMLGLGSAPVSPMAQAMPQGPPAAPMAPTPQTADPGKIPIWAMIAAALGDAFTAKAGGQPRYAGGLVGLRDMAQQRRQQGLDKDFAVKMREFERGQDITRENELLDRSRKERLEDLSAAEARALAAEERRAGLDFWSRIEQEDFEERMQAERLQHSKTIAEMQARGDRRGEKNEERESEKFDAFSAGLMESIPKDLAAYEAGQITAEQLKEQWDQTLDLSRLGNYRAEAEALLGKHLFSKIAASENKKRAAAEARSQSSRNLRGGPDTGKSLGPALSEAAGSIGESFQDIWDRLQGNTLEQFMAQPGVKPFPPPGRR